MNAQSTFLQAVSLSMLTLGGLSTFGCNLVLGIDDLSGTNLGKGGSGGAASTSSTTASGGSGGMASTSSTTTSSSSSTTSSTTSSSSTTTSSSTTSSSTTSTPPPEVTWAKGFGSIGDEHVETAAVAQNGMIAVAGQLGGATMFGSDTLAKTSFFIAYDSTGAPKWSHSFDAVYQLRLSAFANDFILVGSYVGATNVGGAGAFSGSGLFVARYDTNGAHLWSKSFPFGGGVTVKAMAMSSYQEIAVVGDVKGSGSLGGATFNTNGATWGFVALYDGTMMGTSMLQSVYDAGATGFTSPSAVAFIGAQQHLVFAGNHKGTIDYGCGATTEISSMFIVKRTGGTWGCEIAKSFNGASTPALGGSTGGTLAAAGLISGSETFGGPTSLVGNAFVVGLDESLKFAFGKGLNGVGDVPSVVINGTDTFLASSFFGGIDLGQGPINASGQDALAVHTEQSAAEAKVKWARGYGGPSDDSAVVIALDPQGAPVLVGKFKGSATFGAFQPVSAGGDDVFVAKLAP